MKPMEQLVEIQQTQAGILRYFDKICKENNIVYYLSNGTLLGAVKYRGFIPWDDDVDVFVPRPDYDRLVKLSGIDANGYRLFAQERNTPWHLPFAKLCDERTLVKEGTADVGSEHGLALDVFPLDYWNGGEKTAVWQARYCGWIRRCFSASLETEFQTPRTGWKRMVLLLIWKYSRLRGADHFKKKIDKELLRGRGSKKQFCGSVAWSLYGGREVLPAELFAGTVPVQFEGNDYPAPVGYAVYLKSLYGDITQDPPAEQQKPHHHMQVWRKESGGEP